MVSRDILFLPLSFIDFQWKPLHRRFEKIFEIKKILKDTKISNSLIHDSFMFPENAFVASFKTN